MIQILPAIDIIEGRCVRLTQGDYSQCRTYDAQPDEMVRRYADCGVQRIHVVDLDGAKVAAPANLRTLERLARIDGVSIEWGGGIKSAEALASVFDAGAEHAIVGSVAAQHPELFADWLTRYGAQRMVLGADIRRGRVSVSGWTEDLDLDIVTLIERFLPAGLAQCICTDITRDGMLAGPSDALYVDLQKRFPTVTQTVSGGIASMDDIRRLGSLGLRRVIVGKAIYENRITLKEIEQWSQNASSPAWT